LSKGIQDNAKYLVLRFIQQLLEKLTKWYIITMWTYNKYMN